VGAREALFGVRNKDRFFAARHIFGGDGGERAARRKFLKT